MSFTSDLEKFAALAQGNADTVLRKVTYEIAASLEQMSPVDTGRFRANWYLGVGNAVNATNTSIDPSGSATLGRIQGALGAVKIGIPVFITNALPYAERLEFGYSKQAPQGMVRVTAARFIKYINAATQGLNK